MQGYKEADLLYDSFTCFFITGQQPLGQATDNINITHDHKYMFNYSFNEFIN